MKCNAEHIINIQSFVHSITSLDTRILLYYCMNGGTPNSECTVCMCPDDYTGTDCSMTVLLILVVLMGNPLIHLYATHVTALLPSILE